MTESLFASFLFWSAFAFSAGPFWTAIMEEARHSSFTIIYKNYFLYLLTGWLPAIIIIGTVVGFLGGFDPRIIHLLYFVGAGIIAYFGWKVLRSRNSVDSKLDFNWKNMSVMTFTNPKVWLIVPTGFLTANYTDSLPVNIAIFYLLGIPLFLLCVYLWGMLGRQSAKVAKGWISVFNAILLFCFAGYLLYEGIVTYTSVGLL